MSRFLICLIIVFALNLNSIFADSFIIEHYSIYTNKIPSYWTEGDPVPKSWEDHIKYDSLRKHSVISEIKDCMLYNTYFFKGAIIDHVYNSDETATLLLIDKLVKADISFSLYELIKIIETSNDYLESMIDKYKYIIIFKTTNFYSVLFIDLHNKNIRYISKNGYYSGKL